MSIAYGICCDKTYIRKMNNIIYEMYMYMYQG